MQRWKLGATAEPFLPLGAVPQAAHEVPALAAVFGTEEAARRSTAPQVPRLVRSLTLERPDALHRRRLRRFAVEAGERLALGVRGGRTIFPSLAFVRRVFQLYAEMAEVHRCIP